MGSEATIERLRAVMGDDTFSIRFTVEGEIGRGGMGSVHRAIDRASQQPVAIKLLHASAQHARFVLEAETLERLSHPAIVPYIGHGVTRDGDAYLAMGWLEGESLAERLERGPLSLADALAAGIRIASALAHAHAAGIVHRDIKPSNVMLVDKDPKQATLIDFGIAKDTQVTHGLTDTGQLVGTPGYMAPEQAMGTQVLDARTDLFAFGALLHHALVGTPPFDGRQTMEVLAHLLLKDPQPVRELRPEVPARLSALVSALLVKEREQRSSDAAAVEAELTQIASALATADTAALEAPTKIERRRTKRRWPWLAAGAGVLAIGGAIGVLAMRDDDKPAWSSRSLACERDKNCAELCAKNDPLACRGAGQQRYREKDQHGGIDLLAKGCTLGDGPSCALAGSRMRFLGMRGDPAYTRDGWIAMFDRGCTLNDGTSCSLLAEFLLGESRTLHFARALDAYERGCAAMNTASCGHAAKMLDHRNQAGDAERARALRKIQCERGNKSACE